MGMMRSTTRIVPIAILKAPHPACTAWSVAGVGAAAPETANLQVVGTGLRTSAVTMSAFGCCGPFNNRLRFTLF